MTGIFKLLFFLISIILPYKNSDHMLQIFLQFVHE